MNCQFHLVEEAKGGTPLLLHDVVRQFAVETHLHVAQSIFNEVEVVDLRLFVRPGKRKIAAVDATFKVVGAYFFEKRLMSS